jgi:hypothetical protein
LIHREKDLISLKKTWWTVIGARWNDSPEDTVALVTLPGTHHPAGHDCSDELSGWVRHIIAPAAAETLTRARAEAAEYVPQYDLDELTDTAA